MSGIKVSNRQGFADASLEASLDKGNVHGNGNGNENGRSVDEDEVSFCWWLVGISASCLSKVAG